MEWNGSRLNGMGIDEIKEEWLEWNWSRLHELGAD
jgi:hypothetical protein